MKIKQTLPKWFNGTIYEIGDEVRNPFSNETCFLNAKELSMYDFIMGANFFLEMMANRNYKKLAPSENISQTYIKQLTKGLDWFRKHNPKAYMILLD